MNYGRVTPHDLLQNDQHMRTPYKTDQPIEVLIAQLEDTVDYASAGGQAYLTQQIVNLAYSLMFSTGSYNIMCREWHQRPLVDKTWANFKLHFTVAYNKMALTTQGSGFHGANAVTANYLNSTAAAFAMLATATAID
jgi:hypothetical protein